MKTQTHCRICREQKLTPFLDLGKQPLANAFLTKEALLEPEPTYPLRVLFCENCNLCQLGEVVPASTLFKTNYVYFSSKMPYQEHFRRYAEEVMTRFSKSRDDLVVEIGSNDGHFLTYFKEKGLKCIGVDPAPNVADASKEKGIETIPDFFTEQVASNIKKKYGPAKILVGNNVVAHIDDHHGLLNGVRHLMREDGVFIFEAPYLLDMVEQLTFDTIYHEHLSSLSLHPLERLLAEHGMEIIDAKILPVQGNSLRVYAAQRGAYREEPIVQALVNAEKEKGLTEYTTFIKLAREIEEKKNQVVTLLRDLKGKGKRIAGYGAPAKGNTLLNYYGIGPDLLDYVTEELSSKIGRFTPGMHIPVVSIHEARKHPPDYYLLLAWNFKHAALEKEKEFLDAGGKFIMPIGNELVI